MHEYSLARALLHQVEAVARREQAVGVSSVMVTIGEFSGIEPELLSLAFADVCKQSSYANTDLCIEQVALEACCDTCSTTFVVQRFRFVCPQCKSSSVTVVRGEEMILERVVLEAK